MPLLFILLSFFSLCFSFFFFPFLEPFLFFFLLLVMIARDDYRHRLAHDGRVHVQHDPDEVNQQRGVLRVVHLLEGEREHGLQAVLVAALGE